MESSLNGPVIAMGFIEVISEDIQNSDMTPTVEEESGAMSATGDVGVHDDSGGAKQFEDRTKCTDPVRGFWLPLGVGGELTELVYEVAANVLPGTCYPPYTCRIPAKMICMFARRLRYDHT